MSTKMRTYFTVEEWKRLHDLTGLWPLIDDPISTPPPLAAVEAECIEMCKRKWPIQQGKLKPFFSIEGDDADCHYRVYAMMGKRQHCFEAEHADRPAALVELVEKIVEAK